MTRRRRRRKPRIWLRRVLLAIAAIPALYLLAALVGSLVPVNRGWSEPDEGITIYLASNGIHADLILPAEAQGLDWRPLLPEQRFRRARRPMPNGSRSARASGGSISKRRAGATSSPGRSGRR